MAERCDGMRMASSLYRACFLQHADMKPPAEEGCKNEEGIGIGQGKEAQKAKKPKNFVQGLVFCRVFIYNI